jgi:hypothetical protein
MHRTDGGRDMRSREYLWAVTLVAGITGTAWLPARLHALQQSADSLVLDRIFQVARVGFHRTITARLAASPYREDLDAAERAWLADTASGLFDRVIYLGWQKDRAAYDSLRRGGDYREFERRFRGLASEYATRLVDNLFRKSGNFDLLMSIPGRKEARPLALFRASLAWGAKAGPPTLAAGHHATVDGALLARQWWLPVIEVPRAQQVTMGRGVRVAVLDTGIDPTLDLFQGRLAPGVDLLAHQGPPWLEPADNPVWDWGWHGTAVSSVLLTVAPEVTIIPIRTGDGEVSNDPPYPYWLDESVAAGIHAALARGAQVINISAGIDGHPILEEAVDAALARGVVVVAAAGRYARSQKPGEPFVPSFPASYPQVVNAGTFGVSQGVFSWWEPLHPSRTLDVLTPGVDVLMATPSYPEPTKLMPATGSSLSAPVATGIVALMMAADSVTPAVARRSARYARWIEGLLQQTANPRLVGASGFTEHTGYGVVNAAAAVAAARTGMP